MGGFFSKLSGKSRNPTNVDLADTSWGLLGSLVGIASIAAINQYFLADTDLVLIIGSFGASAVLIYGVIESPLAQPRNLVGGHVISAVIGVTVCKLIPDPTWLAAAVAVSLAIGAMHLSRTVHPPGGATALIAVMGSAKIHALGYTYVLVPVASGALLMLLVALITNNFRKGKQYPLYWF